MNSPKMKISAKPSQSFSIKIPKVLTLTLGLIIMIVVYLILPQEYTESARIMLAFLALSVFYWTFEPIPIGLTALILLVFMLVFGVVSTEVVYSGFASPAIFLIIGGMMLARAVNDTPLAERIAYIFLAKWGGTAKGLLASILVIPQIQSFFIPAAAVRTALLLPVALLSLDTIGERGKGNLTKLILLGVAFGSTISGTAVMTAAIGNILTVELLKEFLEIKITYLQWFFYTFPIWIALIPIAWYVLLKSFPLTDEEKNFPHVKKEIENKLADLGNVNNEEKRCIGILLLIVALWFTEPWHGLHPSVPALIGVVLMTLPGIGCTKWDHIIKINFDTVLLMGVTLSLGYAFNKSGAAALVGKSLSTEWIIDLLRSPVLAVITILVLTQILHIAVANVSTAVVTLIPIFIGLASQAGADAVLICLTSSLACLHGYILVVEATPNIIVHSSGRIQQKEFFIPGVKLTIWMSIITLVTAVTWWNWVGLL
ncbi:DASS family sodium-coupled anion symporter [Peribacillus frigoritolerans]|uniref:DASS family sodium-coupled anion symporter n=1 Tax=Peribacillus frigoritolerans TaxID=450367 RepID=UPI0021AA6A42|nr:DASS family sodium-coupled anion symporter [Peribacillus frigoritolerans]MCT4477309.1 DASS family sodium-coupled anion symporter [Peribacillus frigoritolerans]